jgi:hypothetical protein
MRRINEHAFHLVRCHLKVTHAQGRGQRAEFGIGKRTSGPAGMTSQLGPDSFWEFRHMKIASAIFRKIRFPQPTALVPVDI